MKARLYNKYVNDVVPALKAKHKYRNVHQIPRLMKIVVNMGISASLEKNAIDDAAKDLALITGRKAVISKSRHSIANFKLREGQPIGCRVTLRRDAMYEFFDRLIATALPRIRDFRGLSPRKFDGRGNYTFGVADQTIFPEIELDKIKRTQGMDVTIVTGLRWRPAQAEYRARVPARSPRARVMIDDDIYGRPGGSELLPVSGWLSTMARAS